MICRRLADVVYTVALGFLEQDVIVRERLPAPEEFGFDPEQTVLEVWTEFIGAPHPVITSRLLDRSHSLAQEDQDVDFGGMRLGRSRAFLLEPLERDGVPPVRLTVARQWEQADGHVFLIEGIPYLQAAPLLEELPQRQGNLDPPPQELMLGGPGRGRGRSLPARYLAANGLELNRSQQFVASDLGAIKGRHGFVLDYVLEGYIDDFVLEGNTTYHVTGAVTLENSIIEGRTVVKFKKSAPPSANTSITLGAGVQCLTALYAPAVFTAADDNTVGETIFGSSGSPSGYYAQAALEGNLAGMHNLRVLHAQTALLASTASPQSLSNIQIAYCETGLVADSVVVEGRNILMAETETALSASGTGAHYFSGEHLTIAHTDVSLQTVGSANIYLKNSLIAGAADVSSDGWFATNNVELTSASGVFQTLGAGHYYLASNSPYRGAGTPQIDPKLLLDLGRMTTHPPQLLTGTVQSNLTLAPVAPRGGMSPDLGYHYPALDYAVSNLVVQGATLLLTNGVALASADAAGIKLESGGRLISEGRATELNRLTLYNTVQEQPIPWGVVSFYTALITATAADASSEVFLRFTGVSHLAKSGAWNFPSHLLALSTPALASLTMRDCSILGSRVLIPEEAADTDVNVVIHNNVFDRSMLQFVHPEDPPGYSLDFEHNLMRESALVLITYSSNAHWRVCHNLLDNTGYNYGWITFTNSHNAFFNTQHIPGSQGGNVFLAQMDYLTGPLGRFYYPRTGTNLSSLIEAGSVTADVQGLYHFTTAVDQSKKAHSMVDIGFHYPAVKTWSVHAASTGFSSTQGLNHWYYMKSDGAEGLPGSYLEWDQANNRWHAPAESYCLVWATGQHPGTVNDSMRTFEAPYSGQIWISGSIWDGHSCQGTDGIRARVLLDSTPIIPWRTFPDGFAATPMEAFVEVKAGQRIHFQVNRNQGFPGCDSTIWHPILTYLSMDGVVHSVDSDGDGIPDYLEDRDGNGIWNPQLGETHWLLFDTDYDGRSDGQEAADGTDPLDPDDVLPVRLGHWRFHDASFLGEQGEVPKDKANVTAVPGFIGGGANIQGASQVRLRYQEFESDKANINLRRGTVRFWFKPSWSSTSAGGTGPQLWSRLIEMGNWTANYQYGWWAAHLNPEGTQLWFGGHTNGLAASFLYKPGLTFQANEWYHIAFTYSPTNSVMYLNGQQVITGMGSTHYPSSAVRLADGFAVAADRGGGHHLKAVVDELETFNYPLSAAEIWDDYLAAFELDQDGDGLPDWWETHHFGNLNQNAHGDFDADGLTNLQEYSLGTSPVLDESAQSGLRAQFTYDHAGRLEEVSGSRTETIGFDAEGNIESIAP